MFEYIGAIHIHSNYSDGSGEVKDIATDADESGLDYIVLTDHNTLRPLKDGYEGWYGKTLLLIGCEINDKKNQNHYLALGIDQTFSTRLPAKEYVARTKQAGGIGFIAHPHEKRSSMKEHPPYPWTEWDTEDFTGIEIWNHMSEWMERLTEQNKYQSILHPLRTIVSPSEETLKVWDLLSQTRRVVGIGGIDAHAHKLNFMGFFEVEVFPYKVLFKSIRTHILVNEKLRNTADSKRLGQQKKMIMESLMTGRCFVSNAYHGDARGFRFYAENGDKVFEMGDTLSPGEDVIFTVSVPSDEVSIRLIRNGSLAAVSENPKSVFRAEGGGVYRVEVFHNNKAWIYSNHIRVAV